MGLLLVLLLLLLLLLPFLLLSPLRPTFLTLPIPPKSYHPNRQGDTMSQIVNQKGEGKQRSQQGKDEDLKTNSIALPNPVAGDR